jgi:hypothetical protein
MTVRVVMRYLVNKLGLEDDSQVWRASPSPSPHKLFNYSRLYISPSQAACHASVLLLVMFLLFPYAWVFFTIMDALSWGNFFSASS